MWFEFLEKLKEKLSEGTGAKVFIGITEPNDIRDYPFVSLVPAEFYSEADKKIMVLAIAFGVKVKEREKDDRATIEERGTNEILNLMSQIEKVLEENKNLNHFQINEEKETVRHFNVEPPEFLAEMHIAVSIPKFSPAMEDF